MKITKEIAEIETNFTPEVAQWFPGARDIVLPYANHFMKRADMDPVRYYNDKTDHYHSNVDLDTCSHEDDAKWFKDKKNKGRRPIYGVMQLVHGDALCQHATHPNDCWQKIHFDFRPVDGLKSINLSLSENILATLWIWTGETDNAAYGALLEYAYAEFIPFLDGKITGEDFLKNCMTCHADTVKLIDGLDLEWKTEAMNRTAYHKFVAKGPLLSTSPSEYIEDLVEITDVKENKPVLWADCGDGIQVFDSGFQRRIEFPALKEKLKKAYGDEPTDTAEGLLCAVDEYLKNYRAKLIETHRWKEMHRRRR